MKLIAVYMVLVAVCYTFNVEAAQTTRRTTKSIVTTKKPVVTTKKPVVTTKKPVVTPASNSLLKICLHTNSTATSGSIQPLDGLVPVTTGPPRTCNFSIIVPPDQRVQLFCSVAKLSTFNFNLSSSFGDNAELTSYSLRFQETVEIFMVGDPIIPNRVYTSRNNIFLVTYRVVNAADRFNCSWKIIKAPATTTTNFNWCRDEQTAVTSGTIQTLNVTESGETAVRMCPFFINAPPNRQVQMSCSGTNIKTTNGLMTFNGAASTTSFLWRPELNRTTANGNRIDLLTVYYRDDRLDCKWTTANTPNTTQPSVFNYCLRGQSNALNVETIGTIQPIANLTLGSEESRWCLFSIIVPANKRIQVSCPVFNLTNNEGVYNYMTFDGVADSPFNANGMMLPTLNRVYTSIKNRLDVTAFYVKGDKFNCNWKTITIPATTTFTLCLQGETTVANGIIQSLANMTSTGENRMCRFTITAPQKKRVQLICSVTNSLTNMLMEYDEFGNAHLLVSGMIANRNYTSYGNEILLYATDAKTERPPKTTKRIATSTTSKLSSKPTTAPATKPRTSTKKPITTAAPRTGSYKVCNDTSSTDSNGSIKPLDGLAPEDTEWPRRCTFTIVAPTDRKVQISCWTANLTKVMSYVDSITMTYSTSLTLGGTLDLYHFKVIVPKRVYTSYGNTMTLTYQVVNTLDTFDCKWETIKATTTATDFKWCRDGETTAASGTIQPLFESPTTLNESMANGITLNDMNRAIRVCPFFINSSPNHLIQTSCSIENSFSNFYLTTFGALDDLLQIRLKFNKTTANGNRQELLSFQNAFATGGAPVVCNWTTTKITNDVFDQCLHAKSSTDGYGMIIPSDNRTANVCLLSIIAPIDQRLQITCKVINMTSSLKISEITEITNARFPDLDVVYTSISNRIDVMSSFLSSDDYFQCFWKTIKIPPTPTTDFQLCQDGKTIASNGTIHYSGDLTQPAGGNSRLCRFTIIAPFNNHVRISCPVLNSTNNITNPYFALYEFDTFLSVIAIPVVVNTDSQTKTTLKPTTSKKIVTSKPPSKSTTLRAAATTTKTTTSKPITFKSTLRTTPIKPTTFKSTLKTTPVKPTTFKSTSKTTPIKPTTFKSTSKTTSVKPTTLKTTATSKKSGTTTTFKPSSSLTTANKTFTTTASTIKSFQICRDINSTATSGSIRPLDGLTPNGTTPAPKTCTFTIVAPTDQHIQISCSVANLTKIITFFNISGQTRSINSSSLIFNGTLDFNPFNVIIPNRVYTSYNNKMTLSYRVVNASDTFACQWTTIMTPPTTTTDFKWCQDSQTSAASGTIQPLYDSPTSLYESWVGGTTFEEKIRLCPFFINSSPNRQVQMSCSINATYYNSVFFRLNALTDFYFYSSRRQFNMTTINGTRIELVSAHFVMNILPLDCSWETTAPSATMTEFNQCLHVQSTVSNGTVAPLLANNTENYKICLFSVIAPIDQRIQMSCTAVNVTGSLRISGVTESMIAAVPYVDRVYTSISNRIDMISALSNADSFQCNWTTITMPPTTDFKLCRDGEATLANGTIQHFSNVTVRGDPSRCYFNIIAPSNKRVQISCPLITTSSNTTQPSIALFEADVFQFISFIAVPPIVNTTSRGNTMSYGAISSATPLSVTESCDADPWAIVDLADDSEEWKEMTTKAKAKHLLGVGLKIIGALVLLYFFICSLDLLANAFRLSAGRTAGKIFQQSELMQNPAVGLMIGILVTVLVLSSSTSTSIIVNMVGANVLTVGMAIPVIMGANIGTSVTNLIVSFAEIGNKNEFRRAFAGAAVDDIFNWITVFVLFTVEIVCQPIFGIGYLECLSGIVVRSINNSSTRVNGINILKMITDPAINLIVQLDPNVLKGWASDDPLYENSSLIQQCGGSITDPVPCSGIFIFENTAMEDWTIGLIILGMSLTILCGSLVCLVKILHSVMKGHIANVVKHVINGEIPYVPWLTGYIAIFVGAGMTFIVRSSLVFTSALDPLIGVGFISIERVYPLTLGSNIGATTTALLAAFAASPDALHNTLQIALVHLFFNVTGILLFYPIPFMRLPIPMAKFMGDVTAKYRWFAILCLVGLFLLLPATVLGLSIAGAAALKLLPVLFATYHAKLELVAGIL
uniref:Sodium/phosphate cotransporter 2B n=1 Tax=Daphnia galeata TaxID=27404 RepID=A0A8J2RWY3_9CRUS|nr:unnamed protein product [Daphnia galeata]